MYPWRFAVLYMALIFVVSSIEVEVPAVRYFPLRDKGIHFVEYAVLGALCAAAAARSWPAATAWRTGAFAVFVAALWGLSDEIHQAMVPGRSAELADWIADACGAVAGVAAWHRFSNKSVS